MFTPPPSPLSPSLTASRSTNPPVLSSHSPPPYPPQRPLIALSSPPLKYGARRRVRETTIRHRKRRSAWHTVWMVVIVPLILVLVTLLTRFASRPLLLGLLVGPSPGTRVQLATRTDETGHPVPALHRRDTMPSDVPSSTSSASDVVFPSMTPTSSQGPAHTGPTQSVPTIPSSPPVLPTPFPQPFDTTLGNNFTTTSCENFFTNMTQTFPFRQCRPFSFLSQTSSAFLQALLNITALNIDIWGTCNTPVNADQCTSNMGWFASELLVACSREKADSNQMVLQTLASLQTFSLMRQVACLADQNTSTYCYVEAASSSNPADLYFYSLPFGIPVPNGSQPSCSSCTKNVMALFGSHTNETEGLEKTYNAAAYLASSKCGSTYVYSQSATGSSSALPWIGNKPPSGWTVVLGLCALLMGLL